MNVPKIGSKAAGGQAAPVQIALPRLSSKLARKHFAAIRNDVVPRLTQENTFAGKDVDRALSIVAFTRPGMFAGTEAGDAYAEAAHAFVAWAKSAYPSHRLVVGHAIKIDEDFGDWVDRIKIAVIT